MNNLLIILFVMLVLAPSCKKDQTATTAKPQIKPDSTDTTAVVVQKQRLTQLIKTTSAITYKASYEYNTAGYLVKYNLLTADNENRDNWKQSTMLTFEYDADNYVTTEHYSNPQNGNYTGKYVYNGNREVERINYTDDNVLNHYIKYEMQDGKITRMALITAQEVVIFDYVIGYNGNGQVKLIEVPADGGNPSYLQYASVIYDDKINYISTVKGLRNFMYVSGATPKSFCPHNMTSCTYKQYSGAQPTYDSYEYTYNEEDYVVKEVKNGEAEVTEFDYEKY